MQQKRKAENRISKWIDSHSLVSSAILCAVFFLIWFAINSFRIHTAGDDFSINSLIENRELGVRFVEYFYMLFASAMQSLFSFINFHFVFQQIIAVTSVIIINWLFIKRCRGIRGVFFSAFFDLAFFSSYLIFIQFTHTSAVGCLAGMLLVVYSTLYEERKKIRILQIICGSVLVLFSSQMRFDPFAAMFALFCTAACASLLVVFLNLRQNNNAKEALRLMLKRFGKTAVSVILISACVFGLYKASGALKYTVDGYEEFVEYGSALSDVNDYKAAFYYQNQEFYNSIGINSANDIDMIHNWMVDVDFFTVDKLKAIDDNAKIHGDYDRGNRFSFDKVLNWYGDRFSWHFESGFIMIDGLILLVLVSGLVVLRIASKKVFNKLFPLFVLSAMWLFFFVSLDYRDECWLFVFPLLALVLYIGIFYSGRQSLVSIFVSAVFIVLYLYLQFERIHFRATLCIFLPAIVLLIFMLSNGNLQKTKLNTLLRVLSPILVTVVLITSVLTGMRVYQKYIYLEYPADWDETVSYIKEHPENEFIGEERFRSGNTFNPFIKNDAPENRASFGGWDIKSQTHQNKFKKLGINHLFKDAIDGNIVFVFYTYDGDYGLPEVKANAFAEYYNEHYAAPGETIELEKVKDYTHYYLYRVVSEKTQ